MPDGLLIPLALTDDGRLVHAQEGEKGRRFRCPGCLDVVMWRRGIEVRSHFAHQPESQCGESAIHAAAKILVAQTINDWRKSEARRPLVVPLCHACNLPAAERTIPLDLRVAAVVEQALPCGLRPDVLVPGVIAIEVRHTHAVEREKARTYRDAGVRWIEIHAKPLLNDPPEWRVAQSSEAPTICHRCYDGEGLDRRYTELQSLVRELGAKHREMTSEMGQYEGRAARAQHALRDLAGAQASAARDLDAVRESLAEAQVESERVRALIGNDAGLTTLRNEGSRLRTAIADRRRDLDAERSKIVEFLASPCTSECAEARKLRAGATSLTPLLASGDK